MEQTYAGGCLCGAIRYVARGTPSNQTHCHCETCRRASGAPFVSWATFPNAQFSFTAGQPSRYDSSVRAFRQFCARCGTQLTFQLNGAPETIDITLASLDQPASVVPVDHIWTKRQIPWVKLADGLPRFETDRKTQS